MGKINPMNTSNNRELLLGHSILHSWRKNNWKRKPENWTKAQIRKEHRRLVRIMKKRNFRHNTPIN